jgi:hypothetical protein
MWQQQPDYARYKEKLKGEGWCSFIGSGERSRQVAQVKINIFN